MLFDGLAEFNKVKVSFITTDLTAFKRAGKHLFRSINYSRAGEIFQSDNTKVPVINDL